MSKSTTKPSWTGTRKKPKDYPKGYYKGMDSDPFNTQKDVDEFEVTLITGTTLKAISLIEAGDHANSRPPWLADRERAFMADLPGEARRSRGTLVVD